MENYQTFLSKESGRTTYGSSDFSKNKWQSNNLF